ncbi:hypothetical protein ABG067_000352 [Albugo candida]
MSDREKSPASVNEADDNNEAEQEITNPGNNLYVANLAHRVTETELNDLFAKFGRLEKCEVITDPISRESRGFAFVTFEDVRDANDAVQELNGKDIQGRRIRVEHARRKRGHTKTPGRYLGPRLASVKYGLVIVTPEITTIAVITMIVDTAVIMDAAMTMIVVVTTIAVLGVDSSIHIGTPVSCTSAQLVSMRYFTGQLGLDTLSWYYSMPEITRFYLSVIFLTTALSTFGFLNPKTLYLDFDLVLERFQIWRLVTCFMYLGGFSFNFLMQLMILVNYSSRLEEAPFQGGGGATADYAFMLFFGAVIMWGAAFFLDFPFLGPALIFMIVYVWSRRNATTPVAIWGFQFEGLYLPWALIAFTVLIGGNPIMDICGVVAGHLYYFLLELMPNPQFPKVEILDLRDDFIKFELFETDASVANALRRVMIAEVPTLAIDLVTIEINTSVMTDEFLAHRLGMIPLFFDGGLEAFRQRFVYSQDCDCEEHCPNCSVEFQLDVRAEQGMLSVTSDALKSVDPYIRPVNFSSEEEFNNTQDTGVIIAKLGPGQHIRLSAIAKLGIGKEHAKWSPVAVATFMYEPKITLNQAILSTYTPEQKAELYKSCPTEVYETDENYEQFTIANHMRCMYCDECVKVANSYKDNPEDDAAVTVQMQEDKFIFSVETTGQLKPEEVVICALDMIREKLSYLKHQCLELSQEDQSHAIPVTPFG